MLSNYKNIIASVLFVSVIPTVSAYAADKLAVIELLGQSYYVYEVKKGDTLFGIARSQGWNDGILQQVNPTAVAPLKKGMKIYYPVAEGDNTPADIKVVQSHSDQSSLLVHKVKRGETVYGIAHQYGISVETIYRLNPDSRNGIRAGESLTLREEGRAMTEAAEDTDTKNSVHTDQETVKSEFYTVRPGDTLYKLATERGVSVASILKLNPGISESNFKAGSNIKIPEKGTGIEVSRQEVMDSRVNTVNLYEIKKNDTWESIADAHGVSVEMLKTANPGISKLNVKDYVAIPLVENQIVVREVETTDPRESTSDGLEEIYRDVHKIADVDQTMTVKVAIVTENASSKRDLEFIRGFLTAVDKIKQEDYKINVKVVNGSESSESIITALDDFKPTIVFSTNETSVPDYLAQYAEVSRTPVVNTFDVKNTEYNSNAWLVQLLTPSLLFNDNIATYVNEKYGDYSLLFCGTEDDNDQLAASLTKVWNPSKIKSIIGELNADVFDNNGKYIVYGYPVKKNEVSELLSSVVNARQQKPLADILVLGRPNWIVNDEALSSLFHNANVMIPSRFYIEKDSEAYRSFLADYKRLYNRVPVKSWPLYAGVGFDTATYFIPGLAKTGGDMNSMNPSSRTLQSDYDLVRVSNWGGFINPPVFMIRFTPFNTIDKVVINYGY